MDVRAPAVGATAVGPAAAPGSARGRRLHDHVRFEERVAFELLEARLDLQQVGQLGAAVDAAEGSVGGVAEGSAGA
jgi:hypothetical protein